MFSVKWKYKIHPELRTIFEKEYGPEGAWSRFFSTSHHYLGTILQQSTEDENTYFVTDRWTSAEDYDDFLEKEIETYSELSQRFEHLYLKEEKIS